MGLMVHSLSEMPIHAERDYYVYLLRAGWDSEIAETLMRNFQTMADHASRTDAAVIRGTTGKHFNNDVFSWHHLNGLEMEDHLPCVLVTTLHPSRFREADIANWTDLRNDHLLVIPLRKYCETSEQVTQLIESIFRDIRDRKELGKFTIAQRMKAGKGRALMDAVILKPSFAGMGIDLKSAASTLFGHEKPTT